MSGSGDAPSCCSATGAHDYAVAPAGIVVDAAQSRHDAQYPANAIRSRRPVRGFLVRVSLVIVPTFNWSTASSVWQLAEDMGFDAAYTYDHMSWRTFKGSPWYGALPTLAAASVKTARIGLGVLVTSPNFRHPVPLAKDLMTIDSISDGRLIVGVGAGAGGSDATVLGGALLTQAERADRFAEFLLLLDNLLTSGCTDHRGRYYSAVEARMLPGCVQRPRPPFVVAATGPRGMRLAARHGQSWVSLGKPSAADDTARKITLSVIRTQTAQLARICEQAGRDFDDMGRIYLVPAPARLLASVNAFIDLAGQCAEAGVTELAFHYPIPGTILEGSRAVFERLADEALPIVKTFGCGSAGVSSPQVSL